MTMPGSRLVSPGVLDLHLAQHAGDDDLDVLVVDFHALAAIDALDFVQQVLLHGFFAGDPQDVVRHQRTVDQGLAGLDDSRRSGRGTACRAAPGVRVRCRFRCGR